MRRVLPVAESDPDRQLATEQFRVGRVRRLSEEQRQARFEPERDTVAAMKRLIAGRVAIRDALTKFFAAIDSVSHAFTSQLRVDDTLFIEQMVTYTRRDGGAVVLPAASVFELMDGKADRMQMYIDVSPVFAGGDMPSLCRPDEGVMA